MIRANHGVVACFLLFAAGGHGQDVADHNQSLEVGKYDLSLPTPDMPERNRKITVPAEIKKVEGELEIHTQGMLGNKVTLKGAMNDGTSKSTKKTGGQNHAVHHQDVLGGFINGISVVPHR